MDKKLVEGTAERIIQAIYTKRIEAIKLLCENPYIVTQSTFPDENEKEQNRWNDLVEVAYDWFV